MLCRSAALASLTLVLLAACSSREEPRGAPDAGGGDGGGGATDAGGADSGDGTDAGFADDAGGAEDGGVGIDAGGDADGGVDVDAGDTTDAGIALDGGPPPIDAGPGGCTRGTCPTGEYCATPVGACDGVGTCTTIPTDLFCPSVFDPVCGCDGATYGNSCNAHVAGVAIDHAGACGSTS